MSDALTDDIRRTLHSAADRIDVTPPPFTELGASPAVTRSVAPRWVWPLAAAAAVVAVALAVVGLVIPRVDDNRLAAAATTVTVADGVGDVGGVRFPLPTGRSVAVTGSSEDAVTACVALKPASECDGVEFRIAVPRPDGNAPPLTRSTTFEPQCVGMEPTMIRLDDQWASMDGRPAHHYWSYCGSAGAETHLWQLDDMTLEFVTSPGRWFDEGSTIAAGIDLSTWPVNPGAQMVFVTSATSGG